MDYDNDLCPLNQTMIKRIYFLARYAYSTVSIVKCVCQMVEMTEQTGHESREGLYQEAMRGCDMGLLMGAPVLDNVLSRISVALQEYHSLGHKQQTKQSENLTNFKRVSGDQTDEPKSSENLTNLKRASDDQTNEECHPKKIMKEGEHSSVVIDASKDIPRIHCPSLQAFRTNYMEQRVPIIITGLMEHWPARSSRAWSIERIRRIAGLRTVPIEIGSKYTEDSWTQKLMTVNEFIDKYVVSTGDIGYLAQHQLFDQVPELKEDIIIPDYCYLGEVDNVDINAWFGPKGTVSPLHFDPKHNLLSQVIGEKYISLYSDKVSDMVYPYDDMLLCNTSQVDLENPDLEKFPKFHSAPYVECRLKPGEMLYIPPKFWHFVKSLSVSFSVSFWFE